MSFAVSKLSYEDSLRTAYTNVLDKVKSFGTWLDNWLNKTRKGDETLSLAQVPEEHRELGIQTIHNLHAIKDRDNKQPINSKKDIEATIRTMFQSADSNIRTRLDDDKFNQLKKLSRNEYEIKALVILTYILLFGKKPRHYGSGASRDNEQVESMIQVFSDTPKAFNGQITNNLRDHSVLHLRTRDAIRALELLGLKVEDLGCEHLLQDNTFESGLFSKSHVKQTLSESKARAWKLIDEILEIKGIK